MRMKMTGSILILLATCVGAGMLALPVINAGQSITSILGYLIFAWFLMAIGALAVTEVNAWMPENTHLLSMAEKTMGKPGKAITWVVFILLLYSLLCAYLAGMGQVIGVILEMAHLSIPSWADTLVALLVLALVVMGGVARVDNFNRILILLKFATLILLLIFLVPHMEGSRILLGEASWSHQILMVTITSFGYATAIPSLRAYLHHDVKRITKVVLIGGALPFIIYLLWILVVKGALAATGDYSLEAIASSSDTNGHLLKAIVNVSQATSIMTFANVFMFSSMIVSFLAVSLSLVDFLADGFKVNKEKFVNYWLYLLAFFPPLVIVLFKQDIFVTALEYAGIFCVLLNLTLPLIMLYRGRYRLSFQGQKILPFGKIMIILMLILSIIVLIDIAAYSFNLL